MHELKRPFRDGTAQVLFEPLDFLARPAALVPRPRALLHPEAPDELPKPCAETPLSSDSTGSDERAQATLSLSRLVTQSYKLTRLDGGDRLD